MRRHVAGLEAVASGVVYCIGRCCLAQIGYPASQGFCEAACSNVVAPCRYFIILCTVPVKLLAVEGAGLPSSSAGRQSSDGHQGKSYTTEQRLQKSLQQITVIDGQIRELEILYKQAQKSKKNASQCNLCLKLAVVSGKSCPT